MGQLEDYIHGDHPTSPLLKIGLIHAQFETIHPFLDGNGRMGRLLITFFLCEQGVLKRPLLYLSAYLKEHREEYYERLQAVRDSGAWEQWLKFFYTAVWHVSKEASETVHDIISMREEHRRLIQQRIVGSTPGLELLDILFRRTLISVPMAQEILDVSYPTANSLVGSLVDLGLLEEITGQERNRVFRYGPYLSLLGRGIGGDSPA